MVRKNKELERKEAREWFEYATKYNTNCIKESQMDVFEETLRDQIALSALNGLLAGTASYADPSRNKNWANNIAKQAYKVADAMLKARSSNDNTGKDDNNEKFD